MRRCDRPGTAAFAATLCAATFLVAAVNARHASAEDPGLPARQYTEIAGSGQSLYRVAVTPPAQDGALGAEAQTLQEVLSNDLRLIGLFKLLDPRGFLADLGREGMGIELQRWVDVGAQAVVKARARRAGGGARGGVDVEWVLYDTGKGASPVLSKRYSGGDARKLAHRFADDIVSYYTGDRGIFLTRIAYVNRGQRDSQIYVIDVDGYAPRRVSNTGAINTLPAWAPDGSLAYTSLLWQNPDLFLLPPGATRAQRISKRSGLNTGAAWSPDSKRIALTLSQDGNAEIYVIDRAGRIIRRVTNHPGIDTSPTWSPDGTQIAFVSNRAGSPQIYVTPAGGGPVRRLTFSGNYNQEPAWCPRKDTPLVAFTGRDDQGNYDVFTVDVASGGIKRLTQGQGSNTGPAWSPSGRLLAFSSSRGGIWLMNSDGMNQVQIGRGKTSKPNWSR